MMHFQRVFLGLILITMMIGLAGRFTSATPGCCLDEHQDEMQDGYCDQSDGDTCLVCLLRTGVYTQVLPMSVEPGMIDIQHVESLSPTDYPRRIYRPPILC